MSFSFLGCSKSDFFGASISLRFLATFCTKKSTFGAVSGVSLWGLFFFVYLCCALFCSLFFLRVFFVVLCFFCCSLFFFVFLCFCVFFFVFLVFLGFSWFLFDFLCCSLFFFIFLRFSLFFCVFSVSVLFFSRVLKNWFFLASISSRFLLTFCTNKSIFGAVSTGIDLRPLFLCFSLFFFVFVTPTRAGGNLGFRSKHVKSTAVDVTGELVISHPPTFPYPIVLTLGRWKKKKKMKKWINEKKWIKMK